MAAVPDIEDTLINSASLVPRQKVSTLRIKKCSKSSSTDSWPGKAEEADSFIPGSYKIYVKTWGCSHNNSDSEYMAGQLNAVGYNITNNKQEADLWLLNSCTVKTPSEHHLKNYIDDALKDSKSVVVSGCVSQAAPTTDWLKGLSLIGVQQIDRIVEVVEETLKGNMVRLLSSKKSNAKRLAGASLSLPKIRRNPLIEILAINTGCLNRCTYCKTKQARGDLASYRIEELVNRATQSFEEGVKEIWLTSEDLGAYGRDLGVTLPELLKELVKVIPDGCMLRLGMTNPPYILDYLEDIADILNHPRVYAFLHIPVQSGSDSVLSDMKREYTCANFCEVVDCMQMQCRKSNAQVKNPENSLFWLACCIWVDAEIWASCGNYCEMGGRSASYAHHDLFNFSVPGVTIATDVICGFPTETVEDFEETLQLVRRYKFPSLFINQYYPRPGTPAAKLPRIDTVEVKRRTKEIGNLFRSYEPYSHKVPLYSMIVGSSLDFCIMVLKVGHIYSVLVTEESFDGKHYVGHNKFYEQVLLPKIPEILGQVVKVQIVLATKHSMCGIIIEDENNFSLRKYYKVGSFEFEKVFQFAFFFLSLLFIVWLCVTS